MIYDDAQFANLLAHLAIGFTSVGIEAITILAEFLRSLREKCVVLENVLPPPPHGRSMEILRGEGWLKSRKGLGVSIRRISPQGKKIPEKIVSKAQRCHFDLDNNKLLLSKSKAGQPVNHSAKSRFGRSVVCLIPLSSKSKA